MRRIAFWWLAASLTGGVCGLVCAAFLWALAWADGTREAAPAWVFGLPVAGLVVGALLERVPQSTLGGNNLVIRALRLPGIVLPALLLPVAFAGTILGHLFGASVGQEGSAVQMGACAAEQVSRALRLGPQARHQIVTAGVAGGFGAVFGTPIAGAVFAVEFIAEDTLVTAAWLPAIISACVGNWLTTYLGCRHMSFPLAESLPLDATVALRWLLVSLSAAGVARLFVFSLERGRHLAQIYLPRRSLRMGIGGCLILGAYLLLGTSMFLGGGLNLIERAFEDHSLPPLAWLGKLVFTVVSIACGFVGGEVTPLFVMGACLGNVLSGLLALPINLCCGVTMTSLFAAASQAPLSLSVMAIEAMGTQVWPHAALGCAASVALAGSKGIYERPARTEANLARSH